MGPLEEDVKQTKNGAQLQNYHCSISQIYTQNVIFGDSKYELDGIQRQHINGAKMDDASPWGQFPIHSCGKHYLT